MDTQTHSAICLKDRLELARCRTRNHTPLNGSFRRHSGCSPQFGPCFAYGEVGHFRRMCPTNRGKQANA
ncbi:hypothetical protein DPMN_142802 [Dreissena polymorpha]|uniref:CCHC-type domain-containing protein n=1 Tax=Dreissena polymorpha TaxID=45954 RepID=A0A9D4GBS5_DREPO|nr:hypothetical protein DPMN_142802 [Dreissena polymorpha]